MFSRTKEGVANKKREVIVIADENHSPRAENSIYTRRSTDTRTLGSMYEFAPKVRYLTKYPVSEACLDSGLKTNQTNIHILDYRQTTHVAIDGIRHFFSFSPFAEKKKQRTPDHMLRET